MAGVPQLARGRRPKGRAHNPVVVGSNPTGPMTIYSEPIDASNRISIQKEKGIRGWVGVFLFASGRPRVSPSSSES